MSNPVQSLWALDFTAGARLALVMTIGPVDILC